MVRRAAVLALVLTSLSTSAIAAGGATPSSPSSWCTTVLPDHQLAFAPAPISPNPDQNAQGGDIARQDAPGTYVPVLFVHGLAGSDTHDGQRTGAFSRLISMTANRLGAVQARSSLIGQLQELPHAAVFTFDYSRWAKRWVTDRHIAPDLGKAIHCLADASGQKVIIVTHSMGGLATRLALGRPTADGADPGSDVSTVVDFGTPQLGSPWASVLTGLKGPLDAEAESFLITAQTQCPSPGSTDEPEFCVLTRALSQIDPTSAANGLAWHSPAVLGLPTYPAGVQVVSLAGQITYTRTSFDWLFSQSDAYKSASLGDAIVPMTSALSASGEHDALTCNYTVNGIEAASGAFLVSIGLQSKADTRVLKLPVPLSGPALLGDSPCFHSNLMQSIELTNVALGTINDEILRRELPAPDSASPEPSALVIGNPTVAHPPKPNTLGETNAALKPAGFGHARPTAIGRVNSTDAPITGITWDTWGGETATGHGEYCAPNDECVTVTVTASNVGSCGPAQAYRDLDATIPLYGRIMANCDWTG